MKLSVIIPCYNMELYLQECVDSLLDQNLNPSEYEIIIVNDESKDRTLEIANEYATKYDNVKVIDKKNAGVGAARNSGYDLAQGEYIYFLDPDDYLAQNTVPLLLSMMDSNSLDILSFRTKSVFETKYPISDSNLEELPKTLNVTDGITYIAHKKYQNEIWWYIIRRDFIKATGIRFIEGKWMEDAILTAELFCEAKRMAHIDYDVHRYRILPTSAMRNKSREHYNKVIYDNANAAHVYYELMESLPKDHPNTQACLQRLKTRQQSFVFFLLVRLMKSDISVAEIPKMLDGFEKIDAYPLKKFLGSDYHGFSYSFLVFIFNRKPLINPFIKIFRSFYNLFK
ncbi:glycosyltransferase [Cytophaga sp. FL35]|uniref:glycosyltransferase n=1 Tax=Cytophaga sp. FL35 TaxID=1904456 RepID=UPI001653DDFA|nr:glycosyltransferase [Cytophaga sp. FL35]MBC6997976.1 glycosyltransferase [Cytophaga sp. FL35]